MENGIRFGNRTANGKVVTYNIATSEKYRNEESSKFITDNPNTGKLNIKYYMNTEISNILNSYLNKIQESSNYLLLCKPTIDLTNDMMDGDLHHYTLDLTEYDGNETVIVNVPSITTRFKEVLNKTDALNIKKNPDTTVVFNLEDTDVKLSKYSVTVN